MERWGIVRKLAHTKRAEIRPGAADDTASALLAEIARVTQLQPRPVRSGDPLLRGSSATYDPTIPAIWYDRELDPALFVIYLLHEYAHAWIDGLNAACGPEDIDLEPTEDGTSVGANKVEGYSPVERRELQANVFAREFLLPADELRKWYCDDHLKLADIAIRVGVPEAFVFPQLAYALLIPPTPQTSVNSESDKPAIDQGLDCDQKPAAYSEKGPLLVEAGPGTGKTRTLVERIHFLIQDRRVEPKNILVLTFSNRAAEELRERVAKALATEAIDLWTGTFHAFGLELLRKFGNRIGLPPDPRVLDEVAALFLLERLLPKLHLNYYQNLFDPILSLRDILRAISRAKDELTGPEQYRALAEKMRANATEPDAIEAAEKVLEVTRVYSLYQHQLEKEGLLDYGDLIAKSVRLLTDFPDIRKLIQVEYPHVLVDEYQDVNRASAMLLQQLAGSGEGLWVVGDVRQSIYRFRGAAPHNMRAFAEDFPRGRTLPLRKNYRSQPAVLKVLSSLAPKMRAAHGAEFKGWMNARMDEGGEVRLENADNPEAEGKGLAKEIQHQHAGGMVYRDQAVLCRSHGELARVGMILEREGIPILYLGDLFERPEIKDLLALVSIAAGPDGIGLLRVGGFAEYDIPLADILVLIRAADAAQVPFPHALSLAGDLDAISPQGKAGLALLETHLHGLVYGVRPRSMLARYLFDRSQYLMRLLEATSNRAQQQRLAIFQLLEFAAGFDRTSTEKEDPKRGFLENIRRIEVLGEEKQLSQLPETGLAMDAVRLLTIHASKGLEFNAVYLPNLAKCFFPSTRGHRPGCPPPPGLIPWAASDEDLEEEECLFFVALSRAKDFLCLSRPCQVRGRTSNPSDFLGLISDALPQSPSSPVTWTASEGRTPAKCQSNAQPVEFLTYEQEALDRYRRCPQGYYYQLVLGLRGSREDSAYLRLHRCLRDVLRWAQESSAAGLAVDEASLLQKLDEAWVEQGPIDHPFEPIYRESASAMISNAARKGLISSHAQGRQAIEVPLENGRVRFTPDHQETDKDGNRIYRRLKTKRVKAKDDDPVFGLYFAAANDGTGIPYQIEVASLVTGEVIPISLNAKTAATRIGKYVNAIQGILDDAFPPRPEESRDCPRCSFYFICSPPSEEE